MKKYLLPLLTLLVVLSSCSKEDDLLTPVPQPPQTTTTTTNINGDTTNINGDTTTNNGTGNVLQAFENDYVVATNDNNVTVDINYKLVKCTYEYIESGNPANNISFFGYPYSEYGTITNFKNDGTDSLMVNMPMYPVTYMPQPTEPIYFNGQPEWFILTVNNIFKTEEYVDINIDMKRVLCPQTIYDMDFRFFITENNGVLTLTLTDHGNNWTTIQTMCFEPM